MLSWYLKVSVRELGILTTLLSSKFQHSTSYKQNSDTTETKPGHHVSQKTRNTTHPVFSFAQCSDGKIERWPQIHYQSTTLLPNGKGGVPPAHTRTDPSRRARPCRGGGRDTKPGFQRSPGQAAALPAMAIWKSRTAVLNSTWFLQNQ